MSTCACGDYADTRHAFGYAICSRCYEAEDDAIEQVERRDARHGKMPSTARPLPPSAVLLHRNRHLAVAGDGMRRAALRRSGCKVM